MRGLNSGHQGGVSFCGRNPIIPIVICATGVLHECEQLFMRCS